MRTHKYLPSKEETAWYRVQVVVFWWISCKRELVRREDLIWYLITSAPASLFGLPKRQHRPSLALSFQDQTENRNRTYLVA